MTIYNIINNLIKWSDTSLDTRMRTVVKRYNNSKCHGFKPFVVTLKSKELLGFINDITTFDNKREELDMISDIMFKVSKMVYERYDPSVIYTFQNELNVVFYYNESGIFVFDGNIHKTITSLCSFISVKVYKLLESYGLNLDVCFTAEFAEFEQDYEILNYLVWRQMDCRRNTVTLLYKCSDVDDSKVENVKISDMIKRISENLQIDVEETLKHLLTGSVIKKYLFYKLSNNKRNENDIISRKSVGVEHINLSENFKENLQKYIVNKLC